MENAEQHSQLGQEGVKELTKKVTISDYQGGRNAFSQGAQKDKMKTG